MDGAKLGISEEGVWLGDVDGTITVGDFDGRLEGRGEGDGVVVVVGK